MEVSTESESGDRWVFTLVCVATRYPFLRTVTTRDSIVLAEVLLDIILDAGVVFAIHHSDNEFCNLAFEEMIWLLGSRQMFSTALRPQSQGIVERSHREIRQVLAVLLDSLGRATPRKWPKFIRWAEHKLRHKTLLNGASPYQLVHGFAGSSASRNSL